MAQRHVRTITYTDRGLLFTEDVPLNKYAKVLLDAANRAETARMRALLSAFVHSYPDHARVFFENLDNVEWYARRGVPRDILASAALHVGRDAVAEALGVAR